MYEDLFSKKDVKRHSKKKGGFKCKFKFVDCVFEKNFSHMHIYMYIFMKSSFPNHL